VQGAVLVVGLLVLGVALLVAIGGPAGIPAAMDATRQARAVAAAPAGTLEVLEAWAIPVLGSVVATELVARVIAARSPAVAQRSTIAAGALYISVGLVPVFAGLVGGAIIPSVNDTEQLVPALAFQLLPTLGFALFAGALISAILSTVDSTLLVASSLLSHNLIVPAMKLGSERTKVRVARAGVLGFGVVAYVLAMRAEGVFELVEQASAFGSAGTVVCVIFALFTRFGGSLTAYATLASGISAYMAGHLTGASAPFLLSVTVAVIVYTTGGTLGFLGKTGR
jgi:Na+/proline symporter